MNAFKNIYQKNRLIPLLGLFLGVLFWIIDAAVDFRFFNEEQKSFQDVFFDPESMDLWMRTLVIGMLLVFSFIARKILLNETQARLELENYKAVLEQKVAERTLEIGKRNEELQKEVQERKKVEAELQQLATTDSLTGLYNRRMFQQFLAAEIERDKRYRSGLCIIFCDLDHFKLINDHFGHAAGDRVLQAFAASCKKILRDSDIVARWGGEEFVILVPQANLENTVSIAKKLQMATEQIDCPPVGRFTSSFGVTIFVASDTTESFIKRADDALYLAKGNGRNRVESLMPEI